MWCMVGEVESRPRKKSGSSGKVSGGEQEETTDEQAFRSGRELRGVRRACFIENPRPSTPKSLAEFLNP